MNNKGIKRKVSNLVFLVSAAAILLLSSVSFVQVFGMKDTTMQISNSLGEKAAEGSEKALENLALSQIQSLTMSKTQYADAKIQAVIDQCLLITGMAEKIFNNPNEYADKSVERPLAENKGISTAQLLHAETMADGAEAELSKIANLSDALINSTSCNSSVITSQIGSEKGYIIMGDTDANTKADIEYLDPRERSWFKKAKEAGAMVFSDIVNDAFGRGLGFVCANPVFDSTGAFRGVVGVSSLLTEMSTTIANDQLGGDSYTFALDGKGNIIISPTLQKMEDSRNILESSNGAEAELGKRMIAKESGVDKLVLAGKEVYVAYAPLSVTDWSICTVIGVEDVLKPATANAAEITELTNDAVGKIDSSIMFMLVLFIVVVAVILIATIIISGVFSRTLTKPITSLTKSIGDLKDDNIIYSSDITSGDEIEVLSHSFEDMTHRLAEYIENITKITAEKERIGAELNVATHIQANMLPSIFPAFPDRPEFDVYATMTPAKEVGGDFYDFFLVDDDRLALVIADVSGKGVPAALFMVIAKTLIKNAAQLGLSAKQVLEKVNNQLCENNEAGMFVTVWLGLYQISTGRMTCANAGHEFPALRRAGGEYELIKDKHGFVLAGMEGARYREYEIEFHKGDRLYVYTDGVAEATDAHEELFGTDRMVEALNKWRAEDYDLLLHKMKKSIDEFVGDAPQFDDITMLSFEVKSVAGEEE